MAKPGRRNLITDVAGLRVGEAHDDAVRTGVTVLLGDAPFVAAADVRGGAPGSRDIEGLDPVMLAPPVDALVLSGGSVFGLDAAGGAMGWLSTHGRGFAIAPGAPLVPITPSAILFDLANGGDKNWGELPPYRAMGRAAAIAATEDFQLGTAGAGYGATCGTLQGGLGSASAVTDSGVTVGALAAANAVGSALVPGTDIFWAYPFEQGNEFGGRKPKGALPPVDLDLPPDMKGARVGENTTLAIVATDAELSRVELKRIAIMAHDGFARALRPIHTPFDGDIVFALSTGTKPLPGDFRQREILRLGHIAGDCIARAIARGVYEARTVGNTKSYKDRFPA
ncbi:MAG TPA: P1 family peptidase [Rhizomicrobium sp.]|nr:P1 family peptidase [Rhizomicrobium sp.]